MYVTHYVNIYSETCVSVLYVSRNMDCKIALYFKLLLFYNLSNGRIISTIQLPDGPSLSLHNLYLPSTSALHGPPYIDRESQSLLPFAWIRHVIQIV